VWGIMDKIINNWIVFFGFGVFFIFFGLVLAIQKQSYPKTKLKSILAFIGWNIFVPIGIILYIISIFGIVFKIIFLIFKT
jgi:hypothetical protein